MSVRAAILALSFMIAAVSALASGNAAMAQQGKAGLVPEVSLLRGQFEQIRYLKGFRNPLKSEGRFLVSKEKGVVWQGLKPFPSLVVVKKSGKILNLSEKQAAAKSKAGRPNPMMSKMMLAMMAGDQREIEKYFSVQRTETNGTWVIRLMPKGSVARALARVEMKGDRYVRQVSMEEKSGDRTEIHFSALSEQPAVLSPEEQAYFQ